MNYAYVYINRPSDAEFGVVSGQISLPLPADESWLGLNSALIEIPSEEVNLTGFTYLGTETGFVPLPPDGWPDYMDYFVRNP